MSGGSRLGDRTDQALKRVWEPFDLNGLELRNRVVRGPHSTGLAVTGIDDGLIAYHVERAKGGVAMSVIEAAGVHPSCPIGLPILEDSIIDGYRRLTAAVRPHGMRLIQQLFHIGPHVQTPDGTPSWAASYVPGAAPGLLSHPVTVEEIQAVVQGFATAARRCREGGVDGVEIHGAHGYLLHTFLSRATNRRDDEYGGSFENRLRFVREVISAVRAAVGRDYVVGIRLSTEDGVEDGTGAAECGEIARELTAGGQLDYVSMSCGNTGYQSSRVFAYEMPFSGEVTRGLDVATIVSGRFLSLAEADAAIDRGDADLVSMVRALIADPQLVAKTRAGRVTEVRPCIGCNQACVGGIMGPDFRLECTVNVGAGHELSLGDAEIAPAASSRRILVVGGGPAGLEAARVAALAGHQVRLHERGEELGGQLRLARANPWRAEVATVIDWWQAELERLGVEVLLASPVDGALLESAAPDLAILAVGSRPRRDGFQSMMPAFEIPGFDERAVLTSWDVLEGAPVGDSVVVYDDFGHYEGIDVAESLLERGRSVHFVTRNATVGARLEGGAMGWEALGQPHLALLLGEPGFELHPRSFLAEIRGHRVTIAAQDAPERSVRVDADSVVMLSGNLPEREPADSLAGGSVRFEVVGDAVHGPRLLRAAVLSGNLAALHAPQPAFAR
jgi:2,4-dienoyl-CoA reductase-like NADH-dependent reductase (Old Yellow Enzyme family)